MSAACDYPGFERQELTFEIDSSSGNAHGISRRAHSVLVHDFVDDPDHPTHKALGRVMDFLADGLR